VVVKQHHIMGDALVLLYYFNQRKGGGVSKSTVFLKVHFTASDGNITTCSSLLVVGIHIFPMLDFYMHACMGMNNQH
jgi:hypothetical protein